MNIAAEEELGRDNALWESQRTLRTCWKQVWCTLLLFNHW